MQIINISLIVIFIVYGIILLGLSVKSRHFFKTLLFSSLSGIFVFVILQLLSSSLGIDLPVNWWSVSTASLLGIPGVAGMMILNIFF